jgi:putative ABC transport system substrate-binding protein
MVRLQVEVMVVPTQITAELAQQATTTIPIIIMGAGALAQIVPSLAQPGGNVTGFAGLGPELSTKRLELLKQVIPELTRAAAVAEAPGPALGADAAHSGPLSGSSQCSRDVGCPETTVRPPDTPHSTV